MPNNIKEFLRDNTLLFDGAMGTYFAQLFRGQEANCESANLTHPERVLAIHRAYIQSGVNAIKTNTFGVNHGLGSISDNMRKIITAGWHIATEAADEAPNHPFVFADIGPIPPHDQADLAAEYREIVDIFLELGAVNFLFETLAGACSLTEICAYIKKKRSDAFIITSFAVQPDGFTREGASGAALYAAMQQTAADAVGFNCVSGPYHLKEYVRRLPKGGKYLSVMPNAGYPTVIGSRTFFGSNPTYFGGELAEIAALGAKIVGGCCCTTPEHIAAAAEQLNLRAESVTKLAINERVTAAPKPLPNRLLQKAESGRRLLAVELEPPADVNLPQFMAKAKMLADISVDAITIPDCPIGRARMDSSLLACKLHRELSVDVLPHLTCRDRNLNAIKALLLGLSVEGVNNVLIVTGDPIPTAERDEIKSVFNFNSRMLAKYISNLNAIELATPFHICGALNLNALNFDIQLKLAQEKIAGGVQTFLTQPVLSPTAVDNLRRAKQQLPARILAGIMPVMSFRNACFMNNEIAGISVCPEICALYEGKTRAEARDLAVRVSAEIAARVATDCDGYYIISPFNRVDVVADIVELVRARNLL